MTRAAAVATLALAAMTGGCSPPASPAPGERYPCVLHPPSELSPDMVVEQHVVARFRGREGEFDAVMQKRGAELLVVGLGPMNVEAFVIRQVGDDAALTQRLGPRPPFPPRDVIVDVHRVFFKRLPVPAEDGEAHGRIDDEDVTEVWRGAQLRERRFARQDRRGLVRVEFGPGCARDRCAPRTARLVNEWFGYELLLDNRRFTWL